MRERNTSLVAEMSMDIGIYMSEKSLQHKLEFRNMKNPEVTWNMRSCPTGMDKDPQNRLFVASKGAWKGYFVLKKEILFNYRDRVVPFSLLFDM